MSRSEAHRTRHRQPRPGQRRLAAEPLLREFCQALMLLIPEDSAANSVLDEVLPALRRVLAACGDGVPRLQAELDSWSAQARRLSEMARLHRSQESAQLVRSLQQTEAQARSALQALQQLGAESAIEQDNLPAQGDSNPPVLRAFAVAVLGLLGSEPDNSAVLTQVLPSIGRIFETCSDEGLARLRQELESSREAAVGLVELARPHSQVAAENLERRIEQTHAQAARLLTALEGLAWKEPVGADKESAASGANGSGAVDRERAFALFEMAGQQQQLGQLEAAESLYSQALTLDPEIRPARLQRGRVRLLLGKLALALVDLEEGVHDHPGDPLAWHWRGDALALAGRHAEAVRDYDRALQLGPGAVGVRYNRGVALRMLGMYDAARSEFESLQELGANPGPVYLNLGLIALAEGDRPGAVEQFLQAAACRPTPREALERLRDLRVELPKPQQPALRQAETRVDARAAGQPAPRRKTRAEPVAAPGTDHQPGPRDKRRGKRRDRRPEVGSEGARVQDQPTRSRSKLDGSSLGVAGAPSHQSDEFAFDMLSSAELGVIEGPARKQPLRFDPEPPSPSEHAAAESGPAPAFVAAALLGDRTAVRGPDYRSASSAPPADGSALDSNFQIDLSCPSCGAHGGIRWDKLQTGRILACPHCDGRFTARPDGQFVALAKNAAGRWSVAAPGTHRRNWKWLAITATAVAVLACCAPLALRLANPAAVEIPEELEPRARLFGEAWLRKDYKVIRRLTDPAQGPLLFAWHRSHPAPPTNRSPEIEVRILEETPPVVHLAIKFAGLPPQAETPTELQLVWREESGEWLFVPNANRAAEPPRGRPGPERTPVRNASWPAGRP